MSHYSPEKLELTATATINENILTSIDNELSNTSSPLTSILVKKRGLNSKNLANTYTTTSSEESSPLLNLQINTFQDR